MKIPIIKIGTWWFFPKNVSGMTLFPFIFLSKEYVDWWSDETTKVTINHETIHIRQQIEMLILFFYLWYGLEYIIKFFRYGTDAYRNLSFEREAYNNDDNLEYLKTRKFWAFLKYL